MKSIKLLLKSIICLLFSILNLIALSFAKDSTIGIIGFFVFLFAFLILFILSCFVKDNPENSKDKDHQDTNNK